MGLATSHLTEIQASRLATMTTFITLLTTQSTTGMTKSRKPSRRPQAGRYRKASRIPRPVGIQGGGQGGFMGGPASAGMW